MTGRLLQPAHRQPGSGDVEPSIAGGQADIGGRPVAARATSEHYCAQSLPPRGPAMSPPLAELIGTAILIVLGDGVVANVVLQRTKGNDSGWIVITAGWACAVTIAVYCVNGVSGAHLNPAVTIALAFSGTFPWANVPLYIIAQLAGGFLGGVMVWLAYLPHWAVTHDPDAKLAVFSTSPAIRAPLPNLLAEGIGGFALVLALLAVLSPANFVPGSDFAKGFGPVLVGAIVWAIGLSLGGTTGYAINPARDLGPRIAHAVLPISGKGSSDWDYAWVPIAGPILGAVLAASAYQILWKS
jgi:glycerol uptake facilitator protein